MIVSQAHTPNSSSTRVSSTPTPSVSRWGQGAPLILESFQAKAPCFAAGWQPWLKIENNSFASEPGN